MSRMKMLLDVVHDLRELAEDVEALAQAIALDGSPYTDDTTDQKEPQGEATHYSEDTAMTAPSMTSDSRSESCDRDNHSEKIPTLMELRQYASDAIGDSAIRREQVRRILTETFRVNKLTELPQAQYTAFVREVKAHVR